MIDEITRGARRGRKTVGENDSGLNPSPHPFHRCWTVPRIYSGEVPFYRDARDRRMARIGVIDGDMQRKVIIIKGEFPQLA